MPSPILDQVCIDCRVSLRSRRPALRCQPCNQRNRQAEGEAKKRALMPEVGKLYWVMGLTIDQIASRLAVNGHAVQEILRMDGRARRLTGQSIHPRVWTKSCEVCAKTFGAKKPWGMYCSKKCERSAAELVCGYCNKPFQITPGNAARQRCCSSRCAALRTASRGVRGRMSYSGAARSGKRADLGGLFVRSSWEANYARYLNWLQRQGAIARWEYEVDTFEFPVRRGSRFYTPDFKVWVSPAEFRYDEVKGWMSPESKTKLKRMAKYYPHIVVKIIDKPVYRSIAAMRNVIPGWESESLSNSVRQKAML